MASNLLVPIAIVAGFALACSETSNTDGATGGAPSAGTDSGGMDSSGSGGVNSSGSGGVDSGGAGDAAVAGDTGMGGSAAGQGGAAGSECTYQGMGASDPAPVPLECGAVEELPPFEEERFCVIGEQAVFVARYCGADALCTDAGDWTALEASLPAEFGSVTSTQAIGNDQSGVEVAIDLAPGASQATLALSGTMEGIEFCHGSKVVCPAATTRTLNVGESDCSDLETMYSGTDVPASRVLDFLGRAPNPEACPASPSEATGACSEPLTCHYELVTGSCGWRTFALVRCESDEQYHAYYPASCGAVSTAACDLAGTWTLTFSNETFSGPGCARETLDTATLTVIRRPDGVLLVDREGAQISADGCALEVTRDYDWTSPSEYGHYSSRLALTFSGDSGEGTYYYDNSGYCPDQGSADVSAARQ